MFGCSYIIIENLANFVENWWRINFVKVDHCKPRFHNFCIVQWGLYGCSKKHINFWADSCQKSILAAKQEPVVQRCLNKSILANTLLKRLFWDHLGPKTAKNWFADQLIWLILYVAKLLSQYQNILKMDKQGLAIFILQFEESFGKEVKFGLQSNQPTTRCPVK